MEYQTSGFSLLQGEIRRALAELDAQNYGSAKAILENALESIKESYIINKNDSNISKN